MEVAGNNNKVVTHALLGVTGNCIEGVNHTLKNPCWKEREIVNFEVCRPLDKKDFLSENQNVHDYFDKEVELFKVREWL